VTHDELLADTNRLLQRLVEIDQTQRAESERFREEMEARREKMNEEQNESKTKRLVDLGLTPEDAALPEEDWEVRHAEAQRNAHENIERARQKDEEYKEQLLAELRTQSDLLRQIAEKLGR
jgi:hypothetical protein